MNIQQIQTPQEVQAFIDFPKRLYKNDPNYIMPLDKDILAVFDRKKNKLFKEGDLRAWMVYNHQNLAVGRIAAFYHQKYVNSYAQKTGGIGFFESINDSTVASLLFDTAKQWLQEQGMEAMDGPINFGERDKFWGCLVENFSSPIYGATYNFAYYKDLFEDYGFKDFYQQFTFIRNVVDRLEDEYYEKAERILSDPNYRFEHLNKKKLSKYAEDFRIIYNKAWVKHSGVKEMRPEVAQKLFNSMKAVIDERIVWYAYYNNEPVAFFLSLPELNEAFKYVNGKLDLLGKIKFYYHFKIRKVCKTFYGIVFGVTPEHQKKSVEAALIVAASKIIQNNKNVKYQSLILNWVGDFNPKMINVVKQIGGIKYKTHITYRYLFDREKEFTREKTI